MSLDNLRSGINEIDSQLVKLLAERLKLSREIGVEKARTGQSITDLSREASVIANIRRLATDEGADAESVENIYRRIIAASKSVQGARVAFQGEPGAYSQQAAFNFFGAEVETKPLKTFSLLWSAETLRSPSFPWRIRSKAASVKHTISCWSRP